MLALAVYLACSGIPDVSAAEKPRVVLGTFSSLKYNQEAGDLLGVELKIVPIRRGYQGALQIAEGGPSEVIVVDILIQKDRISFQIPASYSLYGGAAFEGRVDSKGITGRFTWKTGVVGEQEHLVRGRGYWDR